MNRLLRYTLLFSGLLVAMRCAAGQALAAETDSPIIRLERTEAAAHFEAIDSALSIEFRRDDQSIKIPAAELVRWGTLGDLRGRESLVLADGSLLSGSIVRIDGSGAAVEHDVFDPFEVPRAKLRGVVLRRPSATLAFDRLLDRLAHEAFAEDTLLLENGDTLSGSLVMPAAGPEAASQTERQRVVVMETAGVKLETPLERIAAIAFRSPAASAAGRGALQVGLRDGDLLNIDSLSASPRSVRIELTGGLVLTTDPEFLWPDLTYLHGNSSRTVELSAQAALSYRHIPLLGWELPLGVNRNVLGGRLRSEGKLFPSGLGMPGSSRVAYRLDGDNQQFQAAVALDDAAGRRGSVVFRVYTQRGGEPLKQAFRSEVLRGGDPAVPVRVDLKDVTLLVLLVDPADRGDELDYANWLDARLLK